jgi:protein gp37
LSAKERTRLAKCEAVIARGFGTFYEVGRALTEIRDDRLYRETHKTFEAYVREKFEIDRRRAYRMIDAATVTDFVVNLPQNPPANEAQAYALVPLKDDPDALRTAWQRAVETAPAGAITAAHVKQIVDAIVPVNGKASLDIALPMLKDRGLFIPDPGVIEMLKVSSRVTFNRQEGDSIEWAQWSWNPVTGCLHGCDFCYARDIANRFYEQGFAPTFLPERLAAPRNTEVPPEAERNVGWKNVFVCSMADLWGKWVPREIIDYVLDEVRQNEQWNFLFLTKFPARYEEFAGELPANAWMGTTVVEQANVERAEKAFSRLVKAGHEGVRWLSIEPMFEPITFSKLNLFDWIVVGGASASTQTPSFVPPIEWYLDLYRQAVEANCQFYMKSNIRMRQYPEG